MPNAGTYTVDNVSDPDDGPHPFQLASGGQLVLSVQPNARVVGSYEFQGRIQTFNYAAGCTLRPTDTPSPTNTLTNTPTSTATNTLTSTPSNTPTNTYTPSNTPTNTYTPSNTPTNTYTPSNTPTFTYTPSNTPTNTYTPTNTPTNTYTPTNTPTFTYTPTEEPDLTLDGQCVVDQLIFTIRNVTGVLGQSVSYDVTGPSGLVTSGTFGPLNAGDTHDVNVGTVPPGDYTLSFTGPLGNQFTTTVTCVVPTPPPSTLVGSGECVNDNLTFTISNPGTTASLPTTYVVLGPNGNLPGGNVPALQPGGSMPPIVYPGAPDGTYTLFTADQAVTVTVVCSSSVTPTPPVQPSLTGSGICTENNELVFTITNNGGSPTGTINYVVFTPSGASLTGSTGPIDAGQSATISLGNQPPGTYTLFTEDGSVTVAVTCNETATPYVCVPETFVDDSGNPEDFPSINTNAAEYCVDTQLPKEWTPVAVGAATCPDWLVYHTNITGDWEIFRLGEYPGEPDANANLTQGVGERITDVSPARSPDSEWIAYTGNDPGNWELFIGRTNGSEQRRVTFNTFAIDTSPAWSPLGDTIAFQTNRNGNWDVYLLNLATGAETQVTMNTANDIYPSWSPDGTKLVFQSDRDGFWQIYEIVIATGVETRLSDGTADDHDPLYSTDGTKIAFRSFRDGANSVIYVMDADGQNLLQISDPAGNAHNAVWSEDDQLVAYNSTLDGDQDIYVYQYAVGDQPAQTRQLTDNTTVDVSPTWLCSSPTIVWTSDATEDQNVGGDNNIFSTSALPIDAPAIDVKAEASQLTEDPANDRDPQNTPPIEFASRAVMQIGEERNR